MVAEQMIGAERLAVPVRGGELTVARWGSGDDVVVAVHGITANHTSWQRMADELGGEVTVLAPDLRGRGDSASLPGPWGMDAHAADILAVLDHLGIERAVLAGHSMGGFVVGKTASEYPDRVSHLVLVDGGVPLEIEWPEGLDSDAKVHVVIGPALERLDEDFGSLEEVLDYWRPHPAVGEEWNDYVERYIAYDVHEVDGVWRSKVSKEAILYDGRDTLEDASAVSGALDAGIAALMLVAPRGIMNQTPGLYAPEALQAVVEQYPHISTRLVEDVNHYSLAWSPRGARALADAVRDAVDA